MELNVLLRGQSNSVLFDLLGGSSIVKEELQFYLGFDGLNDRINLIGASTPDANGNQTMLGSTSFLPNERIPVGSTWLSSPGYGSTGPFTAGAMETSMLGHIASLAADVQAAPTIVLWMHNESDAVEAGLTEASWVAGVRYDAGLVRAALGQQGAATVPYLFVDAIPYDLDDADSLQNIKLGMEALAADGSFGGAIATRSGDLDMNNPMNGLDYGRVIYGGPHLGGTDVFILADRIANAAVNSFARYALPGSPLARAGGRLDAAGPQAVSARLVSGNALDVTVALDPGSSGLRAAGVGGSSGLGWSVRSGASSIDATAAAVQADGSVILSFGSAITMDGLKLYYGYGTGRIAADAETHFATGYPGSGPGSPGQGNSLYDNNGLPIWTSASGLEVSHSGYVATGTGGERVVVSGPGAVVSNGPDTVIGGSGSTYVTGLGSGATVVGGTGLLTYGGGAGSNRVFAGSGGLVYSGGPGFDTVVGSGNTMTVTGGVGGGAFFGGGNAVITAGAGGALNLELGGHGDRLYASGPSGVLFGTVGGDVLMSSAADTGVSAFFGAGGSGTMTFITGGGYDLIATGQGINNVTLGAGHAVVFCSASASAPASGTTIVAGAGSADIQLGGAAAALVLGATANTFRYFALYGLVAGQDHVRLTGFASDEAAHAVASQRSEVGGTSMSLRDGTNLFLPGLGHADAGLFG